MESKDAARPLILITNDDGIAAEGLAALVMAAKSFGELVVVAPRDVRSECSHSVITTRSLECVQVQPNWFAVDGNPADCVRAALCTLQLRPQWVLSGINSGANLGCDVLMSGTVAAAREAALRGFPAIALSQYRHPRVVLDWAQTAGRAASVLEKLLVEPLATGWLWNVNLPAVAPEQLNIEHCYCPLDPNPLPLGIASAPDRYHYQVDYHGRPQTPGHDVDCCFAGKITIS